VQTRPRPRWIAAAVLTLSIGLTAQTPGLPATAAGPPAPTPAASTTPATATRPAAAPTPATAANRTITLITGDRVILPGDDLTRFTVEPGPGRRHLAFRALRHEGRLSVIPSDVAADVTAGKLDRRLFDLGTLLENHYDDARTTSIPLIITYAARTKTSTLAGATVARELPSINGRAVKVAKKDAATFLTGLRSLRSGGPAKIWLDGKRRVTLEQSVPQIGAPTAWEAGHTGKGVSVAVLDTGVDSTHPDLADRIAGTKNFTDGTADDLIGHGTHVASTIAGSGSASGGKYRGVAPDADLYVGKVCVDTSCPDSLILAGMEWAATEIHAKVVNVSIGGRDTQGVDPLEEAVNRLTNETGTLFVIAAGNDGPKAGSVNSPGSADAALTVGAVDKQDKLAEFSGRGPRALDGAIKPDVTAPGVEIVAARPDDGSGERYQAMSGTSMATPHAAGAAALLSQQHPDWKAADLKGALTTSAKPLDGLTPFEQGAGRIDVAQATRQTLTVAPANLKFYAVWPRTDDTPVTQQVTYRNLDQQPVTLAVTATMTGPDGQPAPAGAIELSSSTVTIPAGGTATVDVTSDTRHSGPDGLYSGRVTATGPGATVGTMFTVNKEVESYNLSVDLVGPDGKPGAGDTLIVGLDNDYYELTTVDGTLKRRLPKGRYLIDGYQQVPPWSNPSEMYLTVKPNTLLTADAEVTLDARQTKPFDLTVPEPEASPMLAQVHYELPKSGGYASDILAYTPAALHTAQIGAALPAGELTSWLSSQWAKAGPDGSFHGSPFIYQTMDVIPDGFPTGLTRRVRPGELAVVDQSLHHTSHDQAVTELTGSVPGSKSVTWPVPLRYSLPANRRLFLEGGPATWSTEVNELGKASAIGNPKSYRAGGTYEDHLNVAAFTPTPRTAIRSDDRLTVDFSPTTDATGAHGATRTDTASSRLLRDGRQLAESSSFGQLETTGLSPERAKYVLESTLTRPSHATYSTRIDGRWAFSSSAAQKHLPLLGARYQPTVDLNNTAARTPVTTLPVVVQAQPGATLPGIRTATLQYSADDGSTWSLAKLSPTANGHYRATFPTPKDGKTISLKLHVTDTDGNTTDLTTIAAYHLR